jgi:hypothetical protein
MRTQRPSRTVQNGLLTEKQGLGHQTSTAFGLSGGSAESRPFVPSDKPRPARALTNHTLVARIRRIRHDSGSTLATPL